MTAVEIIVNTTNGPAIVSFEYDQNSEAITGVTRNHFLTPAQIVQDIIGGRVLKSELDYVKMMEVDDLISIHSTFGMWIRNTYGLWFTQNPHTGAINHPDDVSFQIIKDVHTELNKPNPYDYAMSII